MKCRPASILFVYIYALLQLNFKLQLKFRYNKIKSPILKLFIHDNAKKNIN